MSGANQVRLVKRDAGTVYWSAAAVYYDTATADARQGSRQLAITRKYALLTPVKIKDRIVYRESAFTGTAKPGDVLTVRLTAAGSPEWRYLALEDPLPAGVEAIRTPPRIRSSAKRPTRGGTDRASNIATSGRCSSRKRSIAGATSSRISSR